jgi:hypothetical protein
MDARLSGGLARSVVGPLFLEAASAASNSANASSSSVPKRLSGTSQPACTVDYVSLSVSQGELGMCSETESGESDKFEMVVSDSEDHAVTTVRLRTNPGRVDTFVLSESKHALLQYFRYHDGPKVCRVQDTAAQTEIVSHRTESLTP